MLKQIDGRWALVSKKTQRPLAYYRGEGKPPASWVKKQEARVQFFKQGGMTEELFEASYAGNIGIMELIKFKQKASDSQKKQFDQHVKNKKHKEAWKLVQDVTNVKLHKSVHEEQEFVSKAGAGEDGRPETVNKYLSDTPGQSVKKFREYIKDN